MTSSPFFSCNILQHEYLISQWHPIYPIVFFFPPYFATYFLEIYKTYPKEYLISSLGRSLCHIQTCYIWTSTSHRIDDADISRNVGKNQRDLSHFNPNDIPWLKGSLNDGWSSILKQKLEILASGKLTLPREITINKSVNPL